MSPYSTKSIETGITIKAITSIDPDISFDARCISNLPFPTLTEVSEVVIFFESGWLHVEPKVLLTVRNQLFRRIRGGVR